jgi:hypothetical protein
MKECQDHKHSWIVISWVFGRYNQEGHFHETQQHDLHAMQAKQFMCQRCLALADAADLFCIDPLRTALALQQAELAANMKPENALPM